MGSKYLHVVAVLVAVWASSTCVQIAAAAIVRTSGDIMEVSPPPSIAPGVIESNDTIFLFQEKDNFVLPNAVDADIAAPGLYIDPVELTPGTIPSGAQVDVFFLFVDPVGTSESPLVTYHGSITFEFDVLGIFALFESIDATSDLLGADGTSYTTGHRDGTEFPYGTSDSVRLSANRRTLTVDFIAAPAQDQMRIIVAVPEPLSSTLMAIAMFVYSAGLSRKLSVVASNSVQRRPHC